MAHNFGNYLAQQQELIDRRAWVQLPIEAVTIAGADRFSWLNNITTAPMLELQRSFAERHLGIETLILDAAGHIAFACAAADDGERTWLFVDSGVSSALAEFLLRMRFMARVDIEVTPIAAIGVMAPSAELPSEIIEQTDVVWEDPWPHVSAGGAHYGISDSEHPAGSHTRTLLIAQAADSAKTPQHAQQTANVSAQMAQADRELNHPPSALCEALAATGYSEVSESAWEALRIADWRPRPQAEASDDRTLPHELDWLRTAVWLNKGCFPGQETVAKIVNMGRPPRRLVFLYVEGPEGELPAVGTKLTLADSGSDRGSHRGSESAAESAAESSPALAVGVVTSIGRHYELGPVALALVKRTVPADAVLELADGSGFVAAQEVIVSPEGRSSASPQEIPGEKLRKARAALSSEEKPERRR